jgi:hypothetical protein
MNIIENQIDIGFTWTRQMMPNKIKPHHVKFLKALFYLLVNAKLCQS